MAEVRSDIKQKRIKPIHLMHQEGLIDLEKKAVIEAAAELIDSAETEEFILIDLGVWRDEEYKNADGSLMPYQSVDWYIQHGLEKSRNKIQLEALVILDQLSVEPWRDDGRDQYDILIVRSDIYAEEDNFLVGIAREGFGTVISTYRFNGLDDKLKYECIKTETMHELGHVFGLLPDNRTEDVEDSLGLHCANRCIMRQGLNVPEDWINMTKDRLRYDALCKRCEKDLKDYFRE